RHTAPQFDLTAIHRYGLCLWFDTGSAGTGFSERNRCFVRELLDECRRVARTFLRTHVWNRRNNDRDTMRQLGTDRAAPIIRTLGWPFDPSLVRNLTPLSPFERLRQNL